MGQQQGVFVIWDVSHSFISGVETQRAIAVNGKVASIPREMRDIVTDELRVSF
jgi:hypothetical protein